MIVTQDSFHPPQLFGHVSTVHLKIRPVSFCVEYAKDLELVEFASPVKQNV